MRRLLLITTLLLLASSASAQVEFDQGNGVVYEYTQSLTKPIALCPIGKQCSNWTRVPGTSDMWVRAIQDSPDGFPPGGRVVGRLTPTLQPTGYITDDSDPWGRALRRVRELSRVPMFDKETGEYLGDEVTSTESAPEIAYEYDPTGGCVEDDDRCAVVARESCNKIKGKPLTDKVLFEKRTYIKGVECSWVCPDGELGKCTQEVIRKPKPIKPPPVALQP